MVKSCCQSYRLLLVAPPRAQPTLPAPHCSAPFASSHGRPLDLTNWSRNKGDTNLFEPVWWLWYGPVCMTIVFVQERQRLHLIMGAVSLWTRPPALHLCAGP